jgi:hypothetical protein
MLEARTSLSLSRALPDARLAVIVPVPLVPKLPPVPTSRALAFVPVVIAFHAVAAVELAVITKIPLNEQVRFVEQLMGSHFLNVWIGVPFCWNCTVSPPAP